MRSQDYIEAEDSKFVLQLGSFWKGLVTYGATVGFTPADIDAAEKDYLLMEYAHQQQSKVQAYSQAYTSYQRSLRRGKEKMHIEPQMSVPPSVPTPVPAGIEQRFRKRVRRVKSHANYNKVIGEQLRIVAPESTFDAGKSLPKFKIEMKAGRPLIKFKKKHYHAMDIHKDTGDGHARVERVTRSPYLDESKLPEQGKSAVWKYKLIGVINDKVVGNFTGEVTVVVYGEV